MNFDCHIKYRMYSVKCQNMESNNEIMSCQNMPNNPNKSIYDLLRLLPKANERKGGNEKI